MDSNLESGVGLQIERLLPHDHPMILISGVKLYEKNLKSIITWVDINEESLFFDSMIGGVPSYVSLEYIAQTIAALAGIYTYRQGLEPPKGFILGTRKMNLDVDVLAPGRYEIYCEELFFDNEFASFDCKLKIDDKELVSSILNTYRVENMEKFVKENNLG